MTKIAVFALVIFSLFTSCNNDDDNGLQTTQSNEIKSFVWKGLNSWYFWQNEIPELSDSYFSSNDAYNGYLNNYSSADNLFYHLLNNYPTTDKFSWIVDDYNVLLASFAGNSTDFGYNFGLVRINGTDEIYGYVRYVLPNSPAANAGVTRGKIFRKVNGINLTVSNYSDLLFNNTTYTLGFATVSGTSPNMTVTTNGQTSQLTATTIAENPVFYTNTYTMGSKKVGYLVYNSFTSTYNTQLNEAFGAFKSQNITDLVLDLRYNGGGSVETAKYLASMINGNNNGKVFAKLNFNSKHQSENSNYTFSDKMKTGEVIHSLSINKVYVLVSNSSASASELIINGLKPYMNVILIGTKTQGKNMGSITLFDSPSTDYTDTNGVNTSHKWAMQPLVFRISNSLNQSDYSNGFVPETSNNVNELDYVSNLKPLGDTSEPLLAKALFLVSTSPKFALPTKAISNQFLFSDSNEGKILGNEMYVR